MSYQERGGNRKLIEEFIQCYKNEPALWNNKSKEYYNRHKKDAAYDRLIKQFKTIDPNGDREAVIKKINNLRTSYRKELNKMKKCNESGEGIRTPRLWYFDLLNFLYDQEVLRATTSNINTSENEECSTDSTGILSQSVLQTSKNEFDEEYEDCADKEVNPLMSYQSDSEHEIPTAGLRPIPVTSILTEYNEPPRSYKRQKMSEDRFELYGKYVGLRLQELPQQQRILAEKIINETLFLAEMGSLTISHSVKKDDFVNGVVIKKTEQASPSAQD